MDSTLENGLAAIAADREHGAAHIAIDGLWLISAVCEAALMRKGAGAVRTACADAVRALATVRPSMAPVGNAALMFYESLNEQLEAAGDPAPWRRGANCRPKSRSSFAMPPTRSSRVPAPCSPTPGTSSRSAIRRPSTGCCSRRRPGRGSRSRNRAPASKAGGS